MATVLAAVPEQICGIPALLWWLSTGHVPPENETLVCGRCLAGDWEMFVSSLRWLPRDLLHFIAASRCAHLIDHFVLSGVVTVCVEVRVCKACSVAATARKAIISIPGEEAFEGPLQGSAGVQRQVQQIAYCQVQRPCLLPSTKACSLKNWALLTKVLWVVNVFYYLLVCKRSDLSMAFCEWNPNVRVADIDV